VSVKDCAAILTASVRGGPDSGGNGKQGMSAVVRGEAAGMMCAERVQVDVNAPFREGEGNSGRSEGANGGCGGASNGSRLVRKGGGLGTSGKAALGGDRLFDMVPRTIDLTTEWEGHDGLMTSRDAITCSSRRALA
jgi:hypothetical protein